MANSRRMLCLKDVSCGHVEGPTSAHRPGSFTPAELIALQTWYRIMELFLCGHSIFNTQEDPLRGWPQLGWMWRAGRVSQQLHDALGSSLPQQGKDLMVQEPPSRPRTARPRLSPLGCFGV